MKYVYKVVVCSLLVAVLMLFGTVVIASGKIHYTKANWAACLSEADLEQILTYQTQEDTQAIQSMLNQRRCFLVKEDLPVFLEESGVRIIKIRPKGFTTSLYMLREALK